MYTRLRKLMLLFLASALTLFAREGQIQITFYGQSCFLLEGSRGTRILMDPVGLEGYSFPEDLSPHVVTVSHEHRDHNNVEAIRGNPIVLRGVETESEKTAQQKIVPIVGEIRDVRIYNISSFHHAEGSMLNSIFVIELDGLRIAHLGDLGVLPDASQIRRLGKIDVLMIPVGGKYTITPDQAWQVIESIKPRRLILPMHYQTEVADFLPFSVEDFIKDQSHVERVPSNSYRLDLTQAFSDPLILVLDYRP